MDNVRRMLYTSHRQRNVYFFFFFFCSLHTSNKGETMTVGEPRKTKQTEVKGAGVLRSNAK